MIGMDKAGLLGIDHVAITEADVEATWQFYDRLFGTEILNNHMFAGALAVRVFMVGGGARLSVHRLGNGVDLVAARPTPGSADICFRWAGTAETALGHLAAHDIAVVDGASPRRTADGLPAHSVYFRDPDGNLIELMAAY
jgi:catechol 2,3-dioxygenase-like lactoylglutathione lyase family enzyme